MPASNPLATAAWDLRLAARGLFRRRGLTWAAVLTLGLSMGGMTAMLTVADAVLFRPLPYPEPDRLVSVCEDHPSLAGYCVASAPDVSDWWRESGVFSAIGLARDWPFTLQQNGRSEGLHGGLATGGAFEALGARAALGRLIGSDDEKAGSRRVALLSHEAWQSRFGGDAAVLGRSILLDDSAYTVIGVLPAGFVVPPLEGVEIWTPLPFDPAAEDQREWRGFRVYGRLAPGVTMAAALAALRGVQERLAELHPATNRGWGVRIGPLRDEIVGEVRPALLAFLGATLLAVLIACLNVATLLLARWSGRGREIAIRNALGSSRAQLFRLLLLESLLLALAGSVLGLLLAPAATRLFLSLAPAGIPRLDQVTVSPPMLGLALALGVGITLLAGIAPALRSARQDVATLLRQAGTGSAAPGRELLRRGLIVVEIAAAVMLLVGAGLLGRSFVKLLGWAPGFERDHLITVWTYLSPGRYARQEDVIAAYRRMRVELAALPGVSLVSQASAGPVFGGREPGSFRSTDRPAEEALTARWYDVGPAYFQTLGLPLRRGRGITAADGLGAPAVAVINETLAKRLWPGEDPIGRRIVWVDQKGGPLEIVGVAADVPPLRAGQPVEPEIYWPFEQQVRWASYLVVRSSGDPAPLARLLEERLQEAAPGVQVSRPQTMTELTERRLVSPRFALALIAAFAALAVVIAAVGVYGVVNYLVTRRQREIGIRMALGAEPAGVLRLVLGEGIVLALIGAVAGLAGAVATGRYIASMLAGVSPFDPVVLVAVPVLLTLIAALAAWLPARRAVRTDPLVVLRAE